MSLPPFGYLGISQPDSQGYPDLSERSKLEIIPLYILTVTGVSQVVVDSHWHDATRWSYPPAGPGLAALAMTQA